MSTRYVWERYNITDVGEFENRNISEESTLISTVGSYPIIIKANVYNETPTINSDGTINYPAATIVTMQLRDTGDTDNALSEYAGKYFTLQDNVLNFGVKESDNQVHIATNETRIYSGYAPGLNEASVHFVGFETYKTKIVDGPGALQGYSSSNSAGAYPQDVAPKSTSTRPYSVFSLRSRTGMDSVISTKPIPGSSSSGISPALSSCTMPLGTFRRTG